MSHQAQKDFCANVRKRFPQFFAGVRVVDIGSLDINGNNRELFTDSEYCGIDLGPGPNVDIVGRAHECAIEDESQDVVISTEALEHDAECPETLRAALRWLRPGGLLLLTCAGPGRAEHGTRRSEPGASPFTQEFYHNLTVAEITESLQVDEAFSSFEFDEVPGDLRFWGIKAGAGSRGNLEPSIALARSATHQQAAKAQKLFLGIPILNRLDLLERCLTAIDYPATIVVVNNSPDNAAFSSELHALAGEKQCTVLRPEQNLGVAGSWNLLIRTAFSLGFERLFIGSNDTFLRPGSLEKALSFAPQAEGDLLLLHDFDFFLLSKSTIESVGWFDENFYPAYKEDQDYRYRCRLAGARCIELAGTHADAIGSATLKSDAEYARLNLEVYSARNTRYYWEKWGGESSQETFTHPFDNAANDIRFWPSQHEDQFGYGSKPRGRGVSPDQKSLITGVVLARNEESNIRECLEALRPHVAEILLIDMESDDRTVQLARPYVAKVLRHPLVTHFDAARNIAAAEACHEWLWFVDADERIPAEVGRVVNTLVRERGHEFEALTIPFKSYFCGQWMQHCGWWPGYTMPRVLKRGRFHFSEQLHGGVKVDGRQIFLNADPALGVDHFSYRSVEHYVEKLNRYTSTEASDLAHRGAAFSWQDGIREMTRDLWQYYERNPGHLDGTRGWVLSWLSGQYRWLTRAKLLDHSNCERSAPGTSPPDLDAVVGLMEEQLAELRATTTPCLPLGLVWRSPLWDPSGYAAVGRTIAKALASGSRPLAVEDIHWSDTRCQLPDEDVALLRALTNTRRSKSVATITSCIPSLSRPDPRASLNILRTTFETDRIPTEWLPHLEPFDEIWVCSRASHDAFCRGWVPAEKLRIIPECIDTRLFTPTGPSFPFPAELVDRLAGRFVFLSVFDWQLRKGWDLLLKAYARTFAASETTSLLLKISRAHGHPLELVIRQADAALRSCGQTLGGRPDIIIWEANLSEAEMAGLYRSVDAFALPSRGEGWGRPYMEAMASGLPVIGTGASGNMDFMNSRNSFLVPAEEVDVSEEAARELPPFRGHRWFEVDPANFGEAMRQVRDNQRQARSVGRRAAKHIKDNFGPARIRAEVERAVEHAEEKFRAPALPAVRDGQVRLALEGELFAGHSFSIINERLCHEFLHDDSLAVAVSRRFLNPVREPSNGAERTLEMLARREFLVGAEVTIRHAFPPNWERPARGRWVHIQPWEFGSLPVDWVTPLREEVDEIWAPSNYVRWVYESSGIPAEKIRVIPWGVDPSIHRPDAPGLMLPTPSEFAFLFVGGTIPRKGFDLVLEAYLAEFGADEDVCLVVKDMGTDSFYRIENSRRRVQEALANPQNPQILYYDQFLTDRQLASLYTACHCLVAPYRGEGFGLPILEAMACGLAPIIPQGGPSDDFASDETAYFLPAVSVPCEFPWKLHGMPTQLSINVADLRKAMRTAFEQRLQTYEKGMTASRHVRENFTWQKTAQLMSARVRELAGRERQLTERVTCRQLPTPTDCGQLPARKRSDSPKLSLAMIVRDNQRTIGAALESIRPWVDELVIVDTGSTDETPRIAESLGARLFHFPWCDDFSAARNESLKYATGEWVFWMDSDDVIDDINGRKLQSLICQDWPDHVLGHVLQVHCPGPELDADDVTVVDHVKVFRNLPDLRFEGRIHEQILPAIRRRGGDVAWTDIFVVHAGADTTPAGLERKRARDLRLLQLELAERPNHPFTLFNLGMTNADAGKLDMAIEYLSRSIAHAGDSDSFLRKAYSLWIACLRSLGRIEEANEKCDFALRLFPNDPELRFRRANLLTDAGRLEDAVDEFHSVLKLPLEQHFSSIDRGIRGSKAYFNLAIVYGKLGRFGDAETSWRKTLSASPRFRPAWEGLVEVLLRQEKFEDALHAVYPLLQDETRRCMGLVLLAEVNLARGDLAAARDAVRAAVTEFPEDLLALRAACRILFEHLPPIEALPAQQLLAERCPDDAAAHHNLGTLHFRASHLDRAIECYQKALAVRPDFAPTHLYLGQVLHAQGRSKEAETYWARAHELDPENMPSLEDLAQAS